MREIKFRAWDGKRMSYDPELDTHGEKLMNSVIYSVQNAGFKLMQYTGLKDKNGKESFEGDVVRRIYPNDRKKKNEETIDEVRFIEEEGAFCFYQKTSQCKAWSRMYGGHAMFWWEIIGNIYENENLLNNK